VLTSSAALATAPVVTVGGSPATVAFAGLSSAGLDQINLTIPVLPAGTTSTVDLPIVAIAGGSNTQSGLFVTVQSGN